MAVGGKRTGALGVGDTTRLLSQTKVTHTFALPGSPDAVTADAELTVHGPTATETPLATVGDTHAVLRASVTLGPSKTAPTDALKYFEQMIASMRAAGYKPSAYAAIQSMRDSIATVERRSRDTFSHRGPVTPGDKRWADLQVTVEGFVAPKGVAGIFAGRSEAELVNAYLDLDRLGAPPLVSCAGTRDAIARTVGGRVVPGKTPGDWDVVRKNAKDPTQTDVLGTLTDADISDLRDSIAGLTKSNPTAPHFKAQLSGARGRWPGAVPEPLIAVTARDWGDSTELLNRAHAYGRWGAQIAGLVTANMPPTKNVGEAPVAYDARLARWQETSLWKKPADYWKQVSELLSKGLQNDETSDAAFTSLKLAGPNFVHGTGRVTLGADELKAIIEAGRANVQRFGAVDVLSTLGAKVDGSGNVVLPPLPQKKRDQAAAAMKVLFGATTAPQTSARRVNPDEPAPATYAGVKWPTPGFQEGLAGFLAATPGAKADGSMQLSGLTANQQTKLLPEVFGHTTVVQNGELMFDNQDGRYNLIHFGDALSAFGAAFGVYRMGEAPPLFPAVAPIEDRGPAQSYDLKGLIVRHDGVDAHEGTAFGGFEDPGHPDASAWVVVSR